jgi:hypothetical protein
MPSPKTRAQWRCGRGELNTSGDGRRLAWSQVHELLARPVWHALSVMPVIPVLMHYFFRRVSCLFPNLGDMLPPLLLQVQPRIHFWFIPDPLCCNFGRRSCGLAATSLRRHCLASPCLPCLPCLYNNTVRLRMEFACPAVAASRHHR